MTKNTAAIKLFIAYVYRPSESTASTPGREGRWFMRSHIGCTYVRYPNMLLNIAEAMLSYSFQSVLHYYRLNLICYARTCCMDVERATVTVHGQLQHPQVRHPVRHEAESGFSQPKISLLGGRGRAASSVMPLFVLRDRVLRVLNDTSRTRRQLLLPPIDRPGERLGVRPRPLLGNHVRKIFARRAPTAFAIRVIEDDLAQLLDLGTPSAEDNLGDKVLRPREPPAPLGEIATRGSCSSSMVRSRGTAGCCSSATGNIVTTTLCLCACKTCCYSNMCYTRMRANTQTA